LAQLVDHFTDTTLLIYAGLGKPSHAEQDIEFGFYGVLLNTAVAGAIDKPFWYTQRM